MAIFFWIFFFKRQPVPLNTDSNEIRHTLKHYIKWYSTPPGIAANSPRIPQARFILFKQMDPKCGETFGHITNQYAALYYWVVSKICSVPELAGAREVSGKLFSLYPLYWVTRTKHGRHWIVVTMAVDEYERYVDQAPFHARFQKSKWWLSTSRGFSETEEVYGSGGETVPPKPEILCVNYVVSSGFSLTRV